MLAFLALAAVAVLPTAGSTTIPADADQKIRCHREEVTGSLIGNRKVCHTNAEWRQLADDAQSSAVKMVEHGAICTGPSCQGN